MEKETSRAYALRRSQLQTMGLAVLLARAGGSASVTEAEYREVVERYGGAANMAIHVDVLAKPGETADEIRLTLIRKAPENAELVV